MSFDLYLWKAPLPSGVRELHELVERHFDGDRATFEPSDVLKLCHRELRVVVDDLDARSDFSDGLIVLYLAWGTDDDVLAAIAALAAKYQLALWDPQADQLHLPSPDGAVPKLPAGEANPSWWHRLIGGGRQ